MILTGSVYRDFARRAGPYLVAYVSASYGASRFEDVLPLEGEGDDDPDHRNTPDYGRYPTRVEGVEHP